MFSADHKYVPRHKRTEARKHNKTRGFCEMSVFQPRDSLWSAAIVHCRAEQTPGFHEITVRFLRHPHGLSIWPAGEWGAVGVLSAGPAGRISRGASESAAASIAG